MLLLLEFSSVKALPTSGIRGGAHHSFAFKNTHTYIALGQKKGPQKKAKKGYFGHGIIKYLWGNFKFQASILQMKLLETTYIANLVGALYI